MLELRVQETTDLEELNAVDNIDNIDNISHKETYITPLTVRCNYCTHVIDIRVHSKDGKYIVPDPISDVRKYDWHVSTKNNKITYKCIICVLEEEY